ncbi:MAG TPA: hypothetical protein DCZ75_01090 [Geobacter sp.]|nr:hypothetical protein [Geobacter sp.]
MSQDILQYVYVGVFFLLPGCVGAWIAWTKGKNPLLWFLLNGVFPPTLMVTIFSKPARPVQGHYRQCPKCREFSKWRESSCRFCQTDLA